MTKEVREPSHEVGSALAASSRGFTTIELIVCLVIVTILAAIIGIGASGLGTAAALRGSTQQVYGDLQKCRMASVTENNLFTFTLLSATTYRVHDDDDSDGAIDAGEAVYTRDISTYSGGVTMTAPLGASVTFNPRGQATASLEFVMRATNQGTSRVKVSLAGRVKVLTP